MKRITVPEPQIDLYNDGFEGHDMLGRAETGKKLSDLVERIDEPLVIALDGAWGSGKSHFLKCWVGEHLKPEHDHKAETVYFDAFQHDYLDEPLIALTKAITDRLPPDSAGRKFLKSSKRIVSKLAMPTARIAGAVATGGATEVTGALADAAIRSGWKEAEKAAEEFWNKQTAKAAAMDQFRSALEQLTAPNEKGIPQKKLIVVIDELDRCRPDYALQLLEIIKHFFNVPGVHFVLGVNLKELQNSVRARYGAGVDAGTYLQKFITLHFNLPQLGDRNRGIDAWKVYFDRRCKDSAAGEVWGNRTKQVSLLLECLKNSEDQAERLSLRDIDRLIPVLSLVSENVSDLSIGESLVLSSLAIVKALRPQNYPNLRARPPGRQTFNLLFHLDFIVNQHSREYTSGIISYAFGQPRGNLMKTQFADAFGPSGLDDHDREVLFENLAERYLETFTLTRS